MTTLNIQGVLINEESIKTLKSWQDLDSLEVSFNSLDRIISYIALPEIEDYSDKERLGMISDILLLKSELATFKIKSKQNEQ